MLVLTRFEGESIYIGEGADQVEVRVLAVCQGRGRVRIGVAAPREVPVHRAELRDRLRPTDRDNDLPVE